MEAFEERTEVVGNDLKVAVLLTGHLRSANQNYVNLRRFLLDNYDCDVYCASWGGVKEQKYLETVYGDALKSVYLENPQGYYPIKRLYKNSDSKFAYGAKWANRLTDQWHIVRKGVGLLDGEYDAVVRIRFDVFFKSALEITTDTLVIPDDWAGRKRLNMKERAVDHLAYGSVEDMQVYCTLYDYFDDLLPLTDISYAEGLVLYYLREYKKLNVEIKHLDYGINDSGRGGGYFGEELHGNDFKSFGGGEFWSEIRP